MKILVLHGINSVAEIRRTSLHHAFFLPRHAPGHDYLLHAVHAPLTEAVTDQEFDAIVIDTTFLCQRWSEPVGIGPAAIKRKFDFLRDSTAVKIAFPQDEYDHSEVLDSWLADWKVDVIYSVCFDHRALFYPRTSQHAEIRRGYTGLFEPEDIALVSRFAAPWRARRIDVGYRARKLGPYFGWFGVLKSEIGEQFNQAAADRGLTLDISCDAGDAIAGNGWLRFLGQCRFILGCEGGSTLIDPVGDIRARCNAYLAEHPDAGFAEIKAACFPGLDRAEPIKAISPRHFEAAAAGCAQILVPGEYAGALEPWQHYIPLEPDMSNIGEIVAAMSDWDRIEAMIAASREVLLSDPRFSYATYATDVLKAIAKRRPGLAPTDPTEPVDGMLRLALRANEHWSTVWPRWWQSH